MFRTREFFQPISIQNNSLFEKNFNYALFIDIRGVFYNCYANDQYERLRLFLGKIILLIKF